MRSLYGGILRYVYRLLINKMGSKLESQAHPITLDGLVDKIKTCEDNPYQSIIASQYITFLDRLRSPPSQISTFPGYVNVQKVHDTIENTPK